MAAESNRDRAEQVPAERGREEAGRRAWVPGGDRAGRAPDPADRGR